MVIRILARVGRQGVRPHRFLLLRSLRGPQYLGMGLLASVLTLLATAGSALADCNNMIYDEPLPITSASPANGASILQSATQGVPFSIVSTAQHVSSMAVRVTSQNVLGANGTLSDLHQLDFFTLGNSITDPGNYNGVSNVSAGWWPNYPGTYYWQAFGIELDYSYPTSVCHWYASPVFTITVTAPPPPPPTAPPITMSDGTSDAAYMVHQRTGTRPQIGTQCFFVNTLTLQCALRWKAGRYSYNASGRFWNFLGSNGLAYWEYNFSGNRSWRTCRRHHGCRIHRQYFRWR